MRNREYYYTSCKAIIHVYDIRTYITYNSSSVTKSTYVHTYVVSGCVLYNVMHAHAWSLFVATVATTCKFFFFARG